MKGRVLAFLVFALVVAPNSSAWAYSPIIDPYCSVEPQAQLAYGSTPIQAKCGQFPSGGTANYYYSWSNLEWYLPSIGGTVEAQFPFNSTCSTDSSDQPFDNFNVAQADTTGVLGGVGGIAWIEETCFFGYNLITEVDFKVDTRLVNNPDNCSTALVTEHGTWVHEMGHGFGWEHFDSWPSTMNTYQPDITSCYADNRVRPSSDAQQGQASLYGWPDAVDVGSRQYAVIPDWSAHVQRRGYDAAEFNLRGRHNSVFSLLSDPFYTYEYAGLVAKFDN